MKMEYKFAEKCIMETLDNIMRYGTEQNKLEDLHVLHLQIIGLCDTFHQFTTAETEKLREPVIRKLSEM